MQNPGFRYDVQVLRGVAVLLVMLFHANPHWVPGGFLGVDIFFTISGFVIFRLIDHELGSTGSFSFGGFYRRRIIRLFPALFTTIALTVLLSVYLLPVDQLRDILDSAVWSSLSLANVFFYLDSGYFSAQAIEKPLLHLWSLGVEEQFYLAFPVLVVLMAALGRRAKFAVFMLLTLAGAALSQYYLQSNTSAAFYLPVQRVFQFTIGAAVVLLPPPRIGAKAGLGLWLLIIAGVVATCLLWVSESTPLPGWRGLLVALCIAGLLYLGEAFARQRTLLQRPLVQFFGNASYSLYLAHWPVAVIGQYHFGEKSPLLVSSAILLVGLALGTLLHLAIEKPLRKVSVKQVLLYPVSACILVIAWGYWMHTKSEINMSALHGEDKLADAVQAYTPLVLSGDSHAIPLRLAIRSLLSEPSLLMDRIVLGCPPLSGVYKVYTRRNRGVEDRGEQCVNSQLARRELIQSLQPGLVVLAARWELYYTDQTPGYPQPWQDWLVADPQAVPSDSRHDNLRLLEAGLENSIVQAGGARVALIGQTPLQRNRAFRCAKRMLAAGGKTDAEINDSCKASRLAPATRNYQSLDALFLRLQERFDNVIYVNPASSLCRDKRCQLVRDGELLYTDADHLSEAGARVVLQALFDDLAARPGP